MKFLTFEQIKAQLRLDDQQAEMERMRLEGMAEAAEEAVLAITRRTLLNLILTYNGLPVRVVQCALMLVDEWYQHRAPVTQGALAPVPYAFDLMLKPLMRLSGSDDKETEWDDELPRGAILSSDGHVLVDRDYRIVIVTEYPAGAILSNDGKAFADRDGNIICAGVA